MAQKEKELAQVKIDMDVLKKQKVEEARLMMQNKVKEISQEKQQKLKEVKTTILNVNQRQTGTGSCIGDTLGDYSESSPVKLQRPGSAQNSPRGGSKRFESLMATADKIKKANNGLDLDDDCNSDTEIVKKKSAGSVEMNDDLSVDIPENM